jgi:hypothetical protein
MSFQRITAVCQNGIVAFVEFFDGSIPRSPDQIAVITMSTNEGVVVLAAIENIVAVVSRDDVGKPIARP